MFNWISRAWFELEVHILVDSFTACGVGESDSLFYHSVLRDMLKNNRILDFGEEIIESNLHPESNSLDTASIYVKVNEKPKKKTRNIEEENDVVEDGEAVENDANEEDGDEEYADEEDAGEEDDDDESDGDESDDDDEEVLGEEDDEEENDSCEYESDVDEEGIIDETQILSSNESEEDENIRYMLTTESDLNMPKSSRLVSSTSMMSIQNRKKKRFGPF